MTSTCETCDGLGVVSIRVYEGGEWSNDTTECPCCGGEGTCEGCDNAEQEADYWNAVNEAVAMSAETARMWLEDMRVNPNPLMLSNDEAPF